MKKIIALILCLSTVFVFFGCGKKTKSIVSKDFSNISVEAPTLNEELEVKEFKSNDGSKSVNYYNDSNSSQIDTIVNYDNKGNVETYRFFTYDDNGKSLSVRDFDAENNLVSAQAYDYDDNGVRQHIYYYNADGSLKYYEEDIYDSQGNLIAAPLIDAEGNTLASGERTTAAATTTSKSDAKDEKTDKTTEKPSADITEKAEAKATTEKAS